MEEGRPAGAHGCAFLPLARFPIMTLTIPPFSYQIQVQANPPTLADGTACHAVVDYHAQAIRLHAALPPARLEAALRSQFFAAWRYESAAHNMGESAAAQLAANASQMFDRELLAQGGIGELIEMAREAMER